MDKLDKAIIEIIKLKECCDINGYDFQKVPAYEAEKNNIKKAVLGVKNNKS